MVLFASRDSLIAWGSPAAVYLSCFAKKGKPTRKGCPRRTLCAAHRSRREKKATPIHRPYGVPCAARQAGRLSHKGTPTFYPLKRMKDRMHNSRCALRQCSPTSPGLAALLGGGPRGFRIKPISTLHPPLEGEGTPSLRSRGVIFLSVERGVSTRFPSAPLRVGRRIGGCRLRPVRVPRQGTSCVPC
jgi:hypothetical protein